VHRPAGVLTARDPLAPETEAFYRSALETLERSGVPYLIGGAFALEHYTAITRNTHDLDAFVREADAARALDALAAEGYRTEPKFPHWLGKAYSGRDEIDVIYSSGNGVARVDDLWFEHAEDGQVLGVAVKVIPVEEMIWSKAFVQERERYDGGDIAHLLRARAESIDWGRLVGRFGPYWRVLLSHLVLFGFVYPSERTCIPRGVMRELMRRLERELARPAAETRLCQGTLLSREQYLIDVERHGDVDARLREPGRMSAADIAIWTEGIKDK
jgi:hypothetical protein